MAVPCCASDNICEDDTVVSFDVSTPSAITDAWSRGSSPPSVCKLQNSNSPFESMSLACAKL